MVKNLNLNDLNTLINSYALNKNELDSYKKLCEKENEQIKTIMKENNITEFTEGEHRAVMSVSEKTSLNEEKVLKILQDTNNTDFIRTIEVVDMDKLESAIYNGIIDASLFKDAVSVKEITTLRVYTNKK